MDLKGIKVGFGITGSHCTLERVFKVLERLSNDYGAEIFPVLSPALQHSENRFGTPEKWQERLKNITDHPIITSIEGAEPIGPKKLLDVMVIAPCSGNTLAKLAQGIIDSPVLMAAKAHLRNGRPVVLAVSTNDGLGINGKNIGLLLGMKNIYWVPFGQDDPVGKEFSLVAKMELLPETVKDSLNRKQIQPILIEY
ncbi:MAG: dipicolinate synthase subunit B [Bacillota bacterium]|nr:dipicolinate synthase subunit B [Bacillota bacterium]